VGEEKAFDVIVAGGGAAGLLAAARLAAALPGRRIAVLEREAVLGGRLRASSPERRVHSYGLGAVTDALFDAWAEALRAPGDGARELAELVTGRQARMGVLASNKLTEAPIDLWFTPKGARTLGGLTAARQWPEIEEILRHVAPADEDAQAAAEDGDSEAEEESGRSHAFSHHWKKPRKAPAAVVLEHFASAIGIPDVWSAATEALAQRAAFHAGRLHTGDWQAAIDALLARADVASGVTVETGNRIVDATLDEGGWLVSAERGKYRARALVVAQTPWQAASWLRRSYWPAHLLQVASKTKPVSVVVLSERLTDPAVDLPDVVLVPSEKVQIVRHGPGEVCFQATVDFELSLQAPAVVKAVKSLKRARKKLQTLHPGVVGEGNHIALQTVAWAQSPVQTDKRYLEKLDRKPFSTGSLAFCGDAYGGSYDGDANLVRSVAAACDAVVGDSARAPGLHKVREEQAVPPHALPPGL